MLDHDIGHAHSLPYVEIAFHFLHIGRVNMAQQMLERGKVLGARPKIEVLKTLKALAAAQWPPCLQEELAKVPAHVDMWMSESALDMTMAYLRNCCRRDVYAMSEVFGLSFEELRVKWDAASSPVARVAPLVVTDDELAPFSEPVKALMRDEAEMAKTSVNRFSAPPAIMLPMTVDYKLALLMAHYDDMMDLPTFHLVNEPIACDALNSMKNSNASVIYSNLGHRGRGGGEKRSLRQPPSLVLPPTTNSAKVELDLLGKLGRGRYGTVFLVRKDTDARLYALKFVECTDPWEFAIQQKAQRLGVPNLVLQREAWMESASTTLILMDYEPYGDVNECQYMLRRIRDDMVGRGAMSISESAYRLECVALFFTLRIIQTIKAMHTHNLVHGDIKTDNVVVVFNADAMDQARSAAAERIAAFGVKLLDFGLTLDLSLYAEQPLMARAVWAPMPERTELPQARTKGLFPPFFVDIWHLYLCSYYILNYKFPDATCDSHTVPAHCRHPDLWHNLFRAFQKPPGNTIDSSVAFLTQWEHILSKLVYTGKASNHIYAAMTNYKKAMDMKNNEELKKR
ncbi:kinase-like domain-containing protein [Gongronella butleri]|nr:kinase-like domain-containing protein [Gongronella butleri]